MSETFLLFLGIYDHYLIDTDYYTYILIIGVVSKRGRWKHSFPPSLPPSLKNIRHRMHDKGFSQSGTGTRKDNSTEYGRRPKTKLCSKALNHQMKFESQEL